MPGPAPKDPSLRARRNKTSTAAKFSLVDAGVDAPELPPRIVEERDPDTGETRMVEHEWHPRALDLWVEVWSSPMAGEYLDADVAGLYVLVALTDAFWRSIQAGSAGRELATEIRQQRQQYGLDPIARRRLQWEIDRGEEAEGRRRKRNPRKPEADAPGEAEDPRAFLSVV